METNEIDRLHDYREHLKTITIGLREMAKAAWRENYTDNQLLRECYNLINAELRTEEEWKENGYEVRKGQYSYLFWDNDPDTEYNDGFNHVVFLFAKEQMLSQDPKEEEQKKEELTNLFVVMTAQFGTDDDGANIEDNKFYTSRADANAAAKKRFNSEIECEDTWTHDVWKRWQDGDEYYKVTQDDFTGTYAFADNFAAKRFEIYVLTLEGKL